MNNCSQVNGTEDSVSFECSEGFWDGGVAPVTFVAELREADTDRLVANASSASGPAFSFAGLAGGATFRVFLYSANPKGHRSPVHFVVSTLRPAEKLTGGCDDVTKLGSLFVMCFLHLIVLFSALTQRDRSDHSAKRAH